MAQLFHWLDRRGRNLEGEEEGSQRMTTWEGVLGLVRVGRAVRWQLENQHNTATCLCLSISI